MFFSIFIGMFFLLGVTNLVIYALGFYLGPPAFDRGAQCIERLLTRAIYVKHLALFTVTVAVFVSFVNEFIASLLVAMAGIALAGTTIYFEYLFRSKRSAMTELPEGFDLQDSSSAQAIALAEIGATNSGSADPLIVRQLCRVATDQMIDFEIRWLAYISALQVAGVPTERWPKYMARSPGEVKSSMDREFLEKWFG